MTIPSDPQLEQISHADLIAMVRALMVRVDTLKTENQKLRDEIERLKRPKGNSQNLSQSQSRDQKPNAHSGKQNKKHGPPFGHKRFVRKLVDNPDRLIRVDINQCKSCHHDLRATEPSKVIRDLIGKALADVWMNDSFSAQVKPPAKNFQLCIQHHLRDLKRILDRVPGLPCTSQVSQLFREAIHLNNRMISPSSDLTMKRFHRRVEVIGNRLDHLLECTLTDPDEMMLQNRFQINREKLLTFLDYDGVPPTNNASEQAIRTFVIHRKVTNGFRSEWEAKTYANLLPVISTSKIKGQGGLTTLVDLMGPEVLPFLHA